MKESYMAKLGARLVDNGYPVLPIMPGTKKPGQFTAGAWHDYPGWTKHGGRPKARPGECLAPIQSSCNTKNGRFPSR